MNIGKPERIIEVEPLEDPDYEQPELPLNPEPDLVPEEVPFEPEIEPQKEPVPA
jgi:hypothetical protein